MGAPQRSKLVVQLDFTASTEGRVALSLLSPSASRASLRVDEASYVATSESSRSCSSAGSSGSALLSAPADAVGAELSRLAQPFERRRGMAGPGARRDRRDSRGILSLFLILLGRRREDQPGGLGEPSPMETVALFRAMFSSRARS